MTVIWSARGVVLTPAFKTRVEGKVGRLGRVLGPIVEARITCEAEKFRRSAGLWLRAGRRTFSSQATASDLLAAVDAALEAIRRQAREDRDRRRPAKGRSPKVAVAAEPPAAVDEPRLVPRRLVAKPMSVEEAVMQLGLRDDQFLVFRNAQTRDVNVLYRKRDGALGLIEPVG